MSHPIFEVPDAVEIHGCRFARCFYHRCRRANARQAGHATQNHGHSHIAVYASDPAATEHFYRDTLGAVKLPDPENPKGVRYAFSTTQFVEVLPLPENAGINRLDHTAWNTDDAEALRRFLGSRAWKVPGQVEKGTDGSRWFTTWDPEGNKVQFIQLSDRPKPVLATNSIGRHIIHVGFMAHNRAVEDTFYRDLLGFKPYWYGGMVRAELTGSASNRQTATTGWNTCSPMGARRSRQARAYPPT